MIERDSAQTTARWVWVAFMAVITLFIIGGNRKTVTHNYRFASQAWLESQDLYGGTGEGFLYLPAAAIVYMPFHLLPETLGEVLWRVLTIGCYGAGVYRLARISDSARRGHLFLLTTIFTLPLAWSSARNGQSTLLMAGLMMLAAADVRYERWWRTTIWLSLGLAVKPLIVVMSLLTAALYRPLRWRLALGALGVLAVPLLCQSPSYAWEQTVDVAASFKVSVARGQEAYWAQMFGMLRVAGLEVSGTLQNMIRVIAALATLGLCVYIQQSHNRWRTAVYVFSLSALYLMLFNPRTENNTYSLLAPAIAFCAAEACHAQRRREVGFLVGCLIGTVGSFELGRLVTARGQAVWLAPLTACFFTIYLVRRVLRSEDLHSQDHGLPDPAVSPVRRAA